MRRGEQEDGRGFEAKGGDLLFSVNGMPTTGMLPRDIARLIIGIDETHMLLSHYESLLSGAGCALRASLSPKP
jgi:hypothetical protein